MKPKYFSIGRRKATGGLDSWQKNNIFMEKENKHLKIQLFFSSWALTVTDKIFPKLSLFALFYSWAIMVTSSLSIIKKNSHYVTHFDKAFHDKLLISKLFQEPSNSNIAQNLKNVPRRINKWNVKRTAKIIYSVRHLLKKGYI